MTCLAFGAKCGWRTVSACSDALQAGEAEAAAELLKEIHAG